MQILMAWQSYWCSHQHGHKYQLCLAPSLQSHCLLVPVSPPPLSSDDELLVRIHHISDLRGHGKALCQSCSAAGHALLQKASSSLARAETSAQNLRCCCIAINHQRRAKQQKCQTLCIRCAQPRSVVQQQQPCRALCSCLMSWPGTSLAWWKTPELPFRLCAVISVQSSSIRSSGRC